MFRIFIGVLIAIYIGVSLSPVVGKFGLFSEIVDQTRLHATAVLVTLALLFLAFRKWLSASLLSVGVVFNLILIFPSYGSTGCLFSGNSEPKVLRVISLNVNSDNNDVDAVRSLIERSGADFVLVLEANPHLAVALTQALTDQYPYRTFRDTSGLGRGLFGLSKHRIISDENYLTMGNSRQQFLFSPIEFYNRHINIYGVHLLSPLGSGVSSPERIATRSHQLNLLTKQVVASNGNVPFIIAGDMNSVPWQASMMDMKKVLDVRTSVEINSLSGTWPAWLPKALGIPIDHIYYSRELGRLRGGVIDIPGSDHRAVYSDIRVCR